MKFEDLTPKQQEMAKTCTTPEDIMTLAKNEGYELSDEELEAVSGGGWGGEKKYKVECQHCHQVFDAPESWLGCWVHCPLCGTEIWIAPAS